MAVKFSIGSVIGIAKLSYPVEPVYMRSVIIVNLFENWALGHLTIFMINPMRTKSFIRRWNTFKVNENEWVRGSPINYENPVGNG